MKLKLSKKIGLIIGIAILVIAAGVLGTAIFEKVSEKSNLESQLAKEQTRLQGIKLPSSSQTVDLENQLAILSDNLSKAKAKLSDPISSSNATASIFSIAQTHGLAVTLTTSSSTTNESLAGIPLTAISMTATVQGRLSNMVGFVTALNNQFKTGAIKSVEMTVPELVNADNTTSVNGDNTTTIIKLVVYTYRGE